MKIFSVLLVFTFGFVGIVCFNFRRGKQGIRQASFERFNNSCAGRKVPVIFTYDGMTSEGGKLYMNGTVIVKEDILEEPKLSIELERCKNKENLDTCEHFYTYKSNKYCTIADTDNALWSPFYSSFEPKFNCPLKKGIYRATNGTLDLKAILLFPLDSWFWRTKTQLFDKVTNKILSCLFIEAHIGMK